MGAEQGQVAITMPCDEAFRAAVEVCKQSASFVIKRVEQNERLIEGKVLIFYGFGEWPTTIRFEECSAGESKATVEVRFPFNFNFTHKQAAKVVAKQLPWVAELSSTSLKTAKPTTPPEIHPAHVQASVTPGAASSSLADELKKLHDLHEAGALSDEDFERSKKMLLDTPPSSGETPVQPTQPQSATDQSVLAETKVTTPKKRSELLVSIASGIVALIVIIYYGMQLLPGDSASSASCWSDTEIYAWANAYDTRFGPVQRSIERVAGGNCRRKVVIVRYRNRGLTAGRTSQTIDIGDFVNGRSEPANLVRGPLEFIR